MYTISFKESANKELQKLPRNAIAKIIPVIERLVNNPRPGGCKKLEGAKENLYRVRVGDYRVIYLIEDTIRVVEIRKIGHRKDIYR